MSPAEIWDAVSDRPLRDPAHPAVGHLGLADVPRRRDRRIRPARPGGGPQAAQAAPAHRPPRPVRGRPGARRFGLRRLPRGPGPRGRGGGQRPHRRLRRHRAAAAIRTSTTSSRCSPRRTAISATFGRELAATVNPMWLLRSLPNNVLCHIGIRHGLKGPNACITNHSVSGSTGGRRGGRGAARRRGRPRPGGRARRAHRAADGALLPSARAAQRGRAVALRRPAQRQPVGRRGGARWCSRRRRAAAARDATVLGEFLGSGCATEAEGLLAIRADGDGLAGAIARRSTTPRCARPRSA